MDAMRLLFLLGFALCFARADIPYVDVFKSAGSGGNQTPGAPVSFWSPSMVTTSNGTVVIVAQCDTLARDHGSQMCVARSFDSGKSWTEPVRYPHFGGANMVYSATSNTIIAITGCPWSKRSAESPEEASESPLQRGHGCTKAMMQRCNASALRHPSACQECCRASWPALVNASCSEGDIDQFCGGEPGPPMHPSGHPSNSSNRCILTSKDDGATWSKANVINVTNTWGLHYAGNVLASGIELRSSGRLAFASRYDSDPNSAMAKTMARAFVLYSDDQGASWTAGELLPEGWTECQVAEMRNGSLLLTARMAGEWLSLPPYPLRRGFARSDDGGESWAQWWWLEDRQPDVLVGTCENTLVSDSEGILYYSKPGAVNGSRSNYTVHRSSDGGESWEFLSRVYARGAGYSDSTILANGNLGVVFQRTLYNASIEGGGYNGAFAEVPVAV